MFFAWSSKGLEEAINKWLEENPNHIIHDIKLDVSCGNKTDEPKYVAMIIYSQ